jgi:hypothetical protein
VQDTVILVGDLVNKGPFSAEVVQYARSQSFFSTRGNHDDAALAQYLSFVGGKGAYELPPSYDYVKNFSRCVLSSAHVNQKSMEIKDMEDALWLEGRR